MSSPQEAYSRCHKGLTLFSDEPHPRVWFTFHYRNPSRRNPEPLQRSWAHTHNLIGGSQHLPEASQLEVFVGTTNRLGYTMHPRGTSPREHNAPKSNKLLNLQLPRIFVESANRCNKCNGKNTLSGQILLSQIQPKQLMPGRDLRGITKEKHKATPRSRFKDVPLT